MNAAFRFVKDLFGDAPASEFGPLALKAVREAMIETGLSRGVVNGWGRAMRRPYTVASRIF